VEDVFSFYAPWIFKNLETSFEKMDCSLGRFLRLRFLCVKK
jgi:hypothetical protein